MTAPALKQLVDLQRSLYERAFEEARENLGTESVSIARYQKEFESSIPLEFERIPPRKIMEAIERNKVILFGDFHSHKQSQRAFLRVLRMHQNRPDHAPVVVALEMFRSKDQKHIDAWLNNELDDFDLLEATDYDKNWGFPWNNYRPIMEFCKHQSIKIVGINTARAGKDTLQKRDAHAAQIINKFCNKSKKSKIFCMIGEFHLAESYLPKAIEDTPNKSQNLSVLRVFNNLDKFYFALDPDRIHHKDEYLALNKSTFCIINSPPWIKWHSQALWEEIRRLGPIRYLEDEIAPGDIDSDIDAWEDDDDLFYNESIDLDYYLRTLQKQISDFLKINIKNETLERFNIIQRDLDEELGHMPANARTALLERASIEGFAVDYVGRLVYMPDISINNMAAASGQMLFGSLSQISETYTNQDQMFVVQCLKFTFGYIANKILNPRIPLHTIKELENYVLSSRGKRLIGTMRARRQIAQGTIELHTWMADKWAPSLQKNKVYKSIPAEFIKIDLNSSHELAKSLAKLIAGPICRGLVKGKIDTTDIQKWLLKGCLNEKAAKETLAAMITLNINP